MNCWREELRGRIEIIRSRREKEKEVSCGRKEERKNYIGGRRCMGYWQEENEKEEKNEEVNCGQMNERKK